MSYVLKKYYANTPCTFVGTGDIIYIPDDVEVTELEPTTGALMMTLNDKGSQLPPGYTRLAFLENASTIPNGGYGACLIDTGLKISNDTRVEVTGTPLEKYWVDVFCGGGSSHIAYNYSTQPRFVYVYGGTYYYTDVYTSFGQKYNIVADGRDFYIDGKKQESFSTYDGVWHDHDEIPEHEPFKTETYYLFMRSPRYGCGKMRIYDFNVRNGDIQEADYVPVVDPAGIPCMYDKVTKTPKYAPSQSAFFAGIETPDQLAQLSNNLPVATPVYNSSGVQTGPTITLSLSSGFANSEYLSIAMDRITSKNWIIAIHEWLGGLMSDEMSFVPASFLESVSNQYISLGTLSTENLGVYLDVSEPADGTWAIAAGSSLVNSANTHFAYLPLVVNSNKFRIFFNTTNQGTEIPSGKRIKVKYNWRNDKRIEINNDGEIIAWDDGTFAVLNQPFALGCRFLQSQSLRQYSDFWNGKIYSFRASREETELFNFVPALDNTGTPCMYDKITKQSFFNSGSGDFILGVETEYNLDAIIANLTTATPEYDTDGTTQIGPVIKISVPTTWNVDISDGSTSFAKKMYDAAFEKKYILQFSQH